MIQRIQTLYLIVVTVLAAIMNFVTLSSFKSGETLFQLDSFGLFTTTNPQELVYGTFALFAILAAISILSALTIFLYKKRILQIRICLFNILLALGFYAAYAAYTYVIKENFTAEVFFKLPLVFPLIGIVLDWLAIRAIGADEALIRSLDRLR
ncbi:MAG: DUF4293 domain-containing protein [Bacteroidales bacterium]